MFIAINHTTEECRIAPCFATLWHSIILDRRNALYLGLDLPAWELGVQVSAPTPRLAIKGAPIARFIGGTVHAVVVYQNGITKIHRV